MSYQPTPFDTTGVKLPDDIYELVEQLAQNTHDVWAAQRLADGWRYGRNRDDYKKEHPDLVPYAALPDSEKEYDRKMAMEILLAMLAMGYRIESPTDTAARWIDQPSLAQTEVGAGWHIADLRKLGLARTIKLWQMLKLKSEAFPATVYQGFGTNVLRLGEPLLAYDIVMEGLKHWPEDVRLRQLKALALLRSGALQRALDLLEKLKKEGHHDEETLGLLARGPKDLAVQAHDLHAKQKQWRIAYKAYLAAYEKTRGYWTGINAATMAWLLGKRTKALALAKQVTEQCLLELKRLEDDGEDLYWLKATLGEAFLINGDLAGARSWYRQAAGIAGSRYGDLSTSRRNARLLMKVMGLKPAEQQRIESCFRIPRVVVFAGHMIDSPGRLQARFPPHLEKQVQQKIAALLKRLDAGFGYSCAACGSDILFLEAMLKRKGEINIILPFIMSEFIKTSVDIHPGANWGKRFDQVRKRASRVVIANEKRSTGCVVAHEYANLLKDGLAILRAKMLDTEIIPGAVWDGRPDGGPGGLSATIQHWRSQGREPEIINISELLHESGVIDPPTGLYGSGLPESTDSLFTFSDFPQEIRAMLFADVVGYSRLMEEQIPNFIIHFIGCINALISEFPHKPLIINTWGDALYCVFANVKDAGNFSLLLQDRICAVDWTQYGLPANLNLRISLHAGPVFLYEDPLLQESYYTGVHVSRAANIESITPAGQVYASQQFAALASTQRVKDFNCDYVGRVPLPKKAGIVPLYLVHRQNPRVGKRIISS
jgi:class 3 adenylate cyclase/tetratricopeptide (TPR) repeat protein